MVRMSVFGWWIFPDLRLIDGRDHFVGRPIVSAMGQPTRPIKSSIPPGSINTRVATIKRQTRAAYDYGRGPSLRSVGCIRLLFL